MAIRKLVLTMVGGAALLAAPTKVGFVYVSPVGDAGWTFQHDQGRKQMVANLKGQVETQVVESKEGPDAERVIQRLIGDGCKMIFTTSFGYMDATVKEAGMNPKIDFFHATGYMKAPNMGIYNARFYEGRYLCGVVAGKMTKTHIAGVVAAIPIPEVVMGINAFAEGMRSVDPKAEVRVIWVHSWFDPPKEKDATLALIAQGADMITHHTDSTAVVQACEEKHKEKGVWSFSYHSDMIKYGPNSQLTGTVHEWGDFYTKTVKDVLAGTWKGTDIWGGMKDGMIRLAPYNKAVPIDVQKYVDGLKTRMIAGKLHPFAGPVVDQAGKIRVAKGTNITDADLNKMDYYVKGVSGKLEK